MSNYYIAGFPCSAELYHHGIQGQKWGQRRYQNEDGSLTPLGRIHYGYGKARDAAKVAARAVGKGTVATLKTTGKVIKNVAKYGTYPIRKNHAKWLTKAEMAKLMERYDYESRYKKAKLAARGEGLTKKLLDATGKLAFNSLENLGKTTTNALGNKIAERMFESDDARATREAKERTNRNNAERDELKSRGELANRINRERENAITEAGISRNLDRQEHEESIRRNEYATQQREQQRRDTQYSRLFDQAERQTNSRVARANRAEEQRAAQREAERRADEEARQAAREERERREREERERRYWSRYN